MSTIEEIVSTVRNGDKDSFRLIVDMYQQQLFAYAFRLLGNRQEAEDTVQDAFLKAYKSLGRYQPGSSFSAWLYRIVFNHCASILRRRKIIKMLPLFDCSSPEISESMQEEALCRNELDYHMEYALSRLSVEEKNLIILKAVEDKSYEDISLILGIKPETLRKRYQRAREKLREYYEISVRRSENEELCVRVKY